MGEQIALGFGNNIDYEIVWDPGVLEEMVAEFGISSSEPGIDAPITTVRDLVVSILGFLQSGRGGERAVLAPGPITELAGRFDYRVTSGGTSIRAAIEMGKLGYTSALHLVTMNDDVRRLLPRGTRWVCSAASENTYPHLIVQFDANSTVRIGETIIQTDRSDRIIYVYDPDNTEMRLDPNFRELLGDARVLLVSGFNAMQSTELLAARLRELRAIMRSLDQDATVFYEDACFHAPSLSAHVNRALIDAIDIFSLNEDEMLGYLCREIALLDPEDVWRALRDLHRIVPAPVIVVHTKAWAAAYGRGARRYEEALAGGVAMATTRLRLGDRFGPEDYAETRTLPRARESVDFSRRLGALGGEMICCLPSFRVDQENVTTIGLGDAFVGGFLPTLADEQFRKRIRRHNEYRNEQGPYGSRARRSLRGGCV